jgi:NADPH-dependent 2,4-dienoyl-CoA reductase/sulfur reductase-like enzyme
MEAKVEAMIVGSAGRVTHVVTKKGTFEADLVLVAAGIEPNAALARDARIRVGKSGGILTDERQLTNVDGIYAAGDCCEVKSIVTGKPAYIPLATLASRCGWVAGENAAGGKAVFKGAVRAAALKVFSLEVAQVGLTGAEASAAGFNVAVEAVSAYDRIKAMPGSCKVHVHLVVDRRTGRLIGATLFGASGAVMRANVLGVAILQHMTVEDISRFDMIYAPPFAPLWDPVLVAANQARKNLNKE